MSNQTHMTRADARLRQQGLIVREAALCSRVVKLAAGSGWTAAECCKLQHNRDGMTLWEKMA